MHFKRLAILFAGTPGTLLQNFAWSALNADGTENSDITITPSADTKIATAAFSENIAEGKYYIAAESTDYDGFVKLQEIEMMLKLLTLHRLKVRLQRYLFGTAL